MPSTINGARRSSAPGEITLEMDAVALFDLAEIDGSLTHEALDHIRAHTIIAAQSEPTPNGELPGIDRGLPCAQVTMINGM